MKPLDPHNLGPAVHKVGKCITEDELVGLLHGFYLQYENLPWYRLAKKFQFYVAMGTVTSLIDWFDKGKPRGH